MIRKLEVEDITKILYLDDNVTSFFPCEKGEWVQFLIQNVDNQNMFIVGDVEGEEVSGYLVAINSVVLPIDDSVSVLFAYSAAGIEINRRALQMLIDWSKEKKAKSIDCITEDVIGLSVYGFKKKATLMTMELK